ncbi:uncharacterized protein EV154DRAFT_562991 [Mucor mucedo]|uniref:uncharacterized protein n=1 Tax=Mucor mucedo TaxID=29922 RepID=UPI00221E6F74|nr:uncharacterized protein EV154DRAFT_562991 [Mucor mucedo]KAI7891724.1 hypothetical protein EV154DRAFT_562991 [Mucor mucedo]
MTGHTNWLGHSTRLLSLPKELLLEIITSVALESTNPLQIFPTSLIELSQCCKYLYHLVHKDRWRLQTLWPVAFHHTFDTAAIYRRRLNTDLNWQAVLERRCKALYQCRSFAANPNEIERLNTIDWEVIWDMITEHDQYNIPHLLNYQVQFAAGVAFQLGPYRDREVYPVVLPILSLLVNYDFSITRFFYQKDNSSIVSNELSQFAYNFEADALITQHTPLRYFHSWSSPPDQQTTTTITTFYPAQDPLASAFHLFFATIFASHPNIYQAIPGCIPIPLFTLTSESFDVEFLRRYERNLFFASLQESRQGWKEKQTNIVSTTTPSNNIYAKSGFASASHFVSEAHLIEGEWMGYYTFQDTDDEDTEPHFSNTEFPLQNNATASTTTAAPAAGAGAATMEDWFDGPMRLTIKIVPLEDPSGEPINQSSWLSRWLDEDSERGESMMMMEPRKRRKIATSVNHDKSSANMSSNQQFPAKHLRACPLTRFEGTGVDNLGAFSVSGLVDDTEEGQVTWEKNYIDSGETWEYSGRFAWPMGLCGRWGDEEYGGPWWMWKVPDKDAVLPSTAISTLTK